MQKKRTIKSFNQTGRYFILGFTGVNNLFYPTVQFSFSLYRKGLLQQRITGSYNAAFHNKQVSIYSKSEQLDHLFQFIKRMKKYF